MHRDELLRKIRACLRLSTSANEHEAAAALRSDLSEGKSKEVDLKRVPDRDYERGVAAGRAAKLHNGLGGEQQRALESGL